MIKIYPLEWLDALILQTLNPHKSNISTLSDHDLTLICENLAVESNKIQHQLKKQVFAIRKKKQIQLLVRKYHSTLIFLLDTIIENKKDKIFNNLKLSKIIDSVLENVEGLLCLVENRFSSYLSLNERVPVTYWDIAKRELLLKIDKLIKDKSGDSNIEVLVHILSQYLEQKQSETITYSEILYLKELLKSIEEISFALENETFFSPLDELLISLNFNSLHYINNLIDRVVAGLNVQENIQRRLNHLLFHFKKINQLHCNEKNIFDSSVANIKPILENWFKYEITYTERQIELSVTFENIPKAIKESKPVVLLNKIECILSTDQMALILRAGDESRILKAKSMREVFKTIVPHLATPHKSELSYDSMRSKSYVPEERDKEVAIKALERIIRHIKDY